MIPQKLYEGAMQELHGFLFNIPTRKVRQRGSKVPARLGVAKASALAVANDA